MASCLRGYSGLCLPVRTFWIPANMNEPNHARECQTVPGGWPWSLAGQRGRLYRRQEIHPGEPGGHIWSQVTHSVELRSR